ncbi:signal recognition particle receptor alpha subunit, putative [Theileria equi strain WA]|uniref:Signal recognition particle receptor alpha subunit, putative n=1 Tax=Theileria equi strain WA TaxID=1537102 RepID=L0AWB0_THEEQ|nr:signal recognition particle receptor alpha subunit, putative [Theileria equi strain WA]AFZ79316.1 signal recognition particle receptor alpha subunit, putative [Theileria equi strain WA]|eukprot:XP_004828982.1 signal recognition particle receptor alpha subunit, putative [Theileria equi strain WA]
MIDSASAITRGGLIIWSYAFEDDSSNLTPNENAIINTLIRNAIIEERGGGKYSCLDGIHFRWNIINSLDLIFFISYKGIQNTQNLVELLDVCSERFTALVQKEIKNASNINWIELDKKFGFDEEFRSLVLKTGMSNVRTLSPTKYIETYPNKTEGEKLVTNKQSKDGKSSSKVMRQWDVKEIVTQKDMDELDFSDKMDTPATISQNISETQKVEQTSTLNKLISSVTYKIKTAKNSLKHSEKKTKEKPSQGLLDQFSNFVLNYAGNLVITEDVIVSPLNDLKSKLGSKNVAADICDMLCGSISASLIGKRTESLKSLSTTVREALKDAVRRILTPKEPINLMQRIRETNANGNVYSIVFLGVNGVGKSTNLAKVAHLLKSNGFKILLVACDTFRSGAVEQLKIHAQKLDIELFERGYGKDPAQIAKDGLKYANGNGFNVVLIDTAGRMQDNEPLMAALAKLINVNNPNLILFVGEALVGNDAVDQLQKFNHAINKMGENSINRNIDGLILTKFDTVDDKVGTALSMVYITGRPILFVGNGQNYTDLSKLDPDMIIKSLIK